MGNTSFYSNGKLLITGEYLVLDGALSFAIPTSYGQSLTIEPIKGNKLTWKSIDEKGTVWFEDELIITNALFKPSSNSSEISKRLIQILNAAKKLNPKFLNSGFKIESKLTFKKEWGLGSSSTLINNIADWAQVDAYKLSESTFGGSGYDIACASSNVPLTYQLKNGNKILEREVIEVDFNPNFKDHLYFVYLNKKQNSRDGIAHYKKNKTNITKEISEISLITKEIIECKTLTHFESLINKHEMIVSKIINQPTVKHLFFKDFNGSIKSLGAWGGDFILVTSEIDPTNYFSDKGFETVISYKKMIL